MFLSTSCQCQHRKKEEKKNWNLLAKSKAKEISERMEDACCWNDRALRRAEDAKCRDCRQRVLVFWSHWFLGKLVEVPKVNISTEKTPMGNDHPRFYNSVFWKRRRGWGIEVGSDPGEILDPEAGEEMYLKMEGHAILPTSFEASDSMHCQILCVTWLSKREVPGPQLLCTISPVLLCPEGT